VEYTTIANDAPVINLSSPADGDNFLVGDNIAFSASASDTEDGDVTAALSWTSDISGLIGTGGSFSRADLPIGSHQVTVEVSDSNGRGDSVQFDIDITPAAGTIVSTEVRVAAKSDDAEESASGAMNLSSSDLELAYDGTDQLIGMRFNGVDIPQGATITAAYIQFKVDEVSTADTSLQIRGEATDNAEVFKSTNGDISNRPLTAASVGWSPVPWTTVKEVGPDQQTPPIATVIQEIVNRPGWASGNSLAVIVSGTGKRTAESYNGDSSGAPLLHVEYVLAP
jgi:hypothetical protein